MKNIEEKNDFDYNWAYEWTKVSDQKPNCNRKVMVSTVYIENNTYIRDYFISDFNKNYDFPWINIPSEDIVTHWMDFYKVKDKTFND